MRQSWKELKKQTLENNKEIKKEYDILKMKTDIILSLIHI